MIDLGGLEVTVALAELERAVIAAEAESGRSVPNARRPLTEVEFAAGVRFGRIDALVQETAAAMVEVARKVTDHIEAELPTLTRGLTPAQVAGLLSRMASPTTGLDVPGIHEAEAVAHRDARAALEEAWARTAQGVLDEAASQGAQDLPPVVPVDAVTVDVIDAAVSTVITAWVSRWLTVAVDAARAYAQQPISDMSAALASPFTMVDVILEAVRAASTAAATDLARQGTHQTVSASRGSQARAPGMPPIKEVYASELLDSKTCDVCASYDGVNFASMEEAWQVYREHGGNRSCEGALRCRGVLVIVWATEQDPTVRDTPEPGPFLPPTVPVVPQPAPPTDPRTATRPVQEMPYEIKPEVVRDSTIDTQMPRRSKKVREKVMKDLEDSFAEVAAQDVKIRVPQDVVDDLFRDGRFRNAHEVRTEATGYMEMRTNIERRFLGVPDSSAITDRPIYGAINNYDQAHRFGDFTVVLREDVKNRTTLIVGDSFNGANPVRLSSLMDGTSSIDDLTRAVNDYDWAVIRSGDKSIKDVNVYWETQTHGGVTLDDIERLEVPDGWIDTLSPATRAALERSGIDVVVVR